MQNLVNSQQSAVGSRQSAVDFIARIKARSLSRVQKAIKLFVPVPKGRGFS